VCKVDSLTVETVGLHSNPIRENDSETGPAPVKLTIDADPLCIRTQFIVTIGLTLEGK